MAMTTKELMAYVQTNLKAGEEMAITTKQMAHLNGVLHLLNMSGKYHYRFTHDFTRIKKELK